MVALAKDRNTPLREGTIYRHPVGADAVIFAGALVCLNATGWAVKGAVATTLIAVGRAEEHVDNDGGANGAKSVDVRSGTFRFENSASADEIGRTEIGKDVYIVDDQTVAKTNGSSTRSVAGKCVDVDDQGVWVRIGPAA